MTGAAKEAELESGHPARQVVRMAMTLIGVVALVAGAFVDWVAQRVGDDMSLKALVATGFPARGDFVKTVGALTILIALVGLLALVDRTGWLTRLAGAAALVVFVMFAVQAYRTYGHDMGTAYHHTRAGAWLLLGGGAVLLIGGFFGARVVTVPATVKTERGKRSKRGKVAARESKA
ncbi:hypothetical protein KDL01_38055 [Actinospica durhamensis]|uniref:Uncharacterized protein n=1 Tax=Actinospica durhamensis TaxID=1508375 RepID=A0A941IT00_9ACTN|nr:hypothetical protein [Actinospica durhamensis]MBR7839129.1 hypothetical protein [Actinospica durhamensis]